MEFNEECQKVIRRYLHQEDEIKSLRELYKTLAMSIEDNRRLIRRLKRCNRNLLNRLEAMHVRLYGYF